MLTEVSIPAPRGASFPISISNLRFQISDFRFQISDLRSQISDPLRVSLPVRLCTSLRSILFQSNKIMPCRAPTRIGHHFTDPISTASASSSPAAPALSARTSLPHSRSSAANVVVLDDLSGSDESNLSNIPRVQFHRGSILDQSLLATATKDSAYVFHQARAGQACRGA